MSSVKNATELIKWISTKISQIVLWIEDGTRTIEELSPLKEAIQAVIDRRPFRIEFLEPIIKLSLSVLGTPSQVTLPALTESFDPGKFFQTRSDLYLWGDFKSRILSVAKAVESLPEMNIASCDLIKAATDAEIRGELPKDHVWQDASSFCGYLAGLLEKQKNGKEGTLLNGYTNLFYVIGKDGEVFAVRVYWYSDSRRHVYASRLGNDQRDAGSRAFSATAGS